MRWGRSCAEERARRFGPRRWFAWRPVRVCGGGDLNRDRDGWIWLEPVARIRNTRHDGVWDFVDKKWLYKPWAAHVRAQFEKKETFSV